MRTPSILDGRAARTAVRDVILRSTLWEPVRRKHAAEGGIASHLEHAMS